MTTENCGGCRFHDTAGRNNRNGECKNPESRWHGIVIGPQGACPGWIETPPIIPDDETPI
ncbi:MAG: hypothetical protein AB7S71_18200 [Dongiaceae bacterium]